MVEADATSARSASPSLEDRVELERVRIFIGHAAGNMINILIGAVLIAIVLRRDGVSVTLLAGWFVSLTAVCIAVAAFERHVKRIGIDAGNCRRLRNVRIAFGATMALYYGVAAFLAPATGNHAQDTFLFIIVSAMVMVAAMGYAVMPMYYMVINAVSLLPLTAHFIWEYAAGRDDYYLLLICVSLVWQVVVLVKARRVSQTSIDAIVLNQRLRDEIEEHDRTKEAIRHMALHDVLTGLANRRYFEDMIERALSNAEREGDRFGLVIIDLDGFNPVNDRYGHAVGDAVLKVVADRLHGMMRAGDFCARIGGDEFAVIVGGVGTAGDLMLVADKIRAALAAPVAVDGRAAIEVGASVGHALCPDDGETADGLVVVADGRMYQAKQRGRSQASLAD